MVPLLTALAAVFVVFAPIQAEMPTVRLTYADVQPESQDIPTNNPEPPELCDWLECYCVKWLREARGINIRGDAGTIQPNTTVAEMHPGDVLLLSYGDVEHAAEFLHFSERGNPVIIEANFERGEVTKREIDLSKERVRGVFTSKTGDATIPTIASVNDGGDRGTTQRAALAKGRH